MALRKIGFIKWVVIIFVFMLMYISCTGKNRQPLKQDESLEKKVEGLTLKLQRMEDINAIQNIMGKMFYLYEAGMYEERMKYIAKNTPGVNIEIGARGVFEGYESARRTLVDTEKYYERSHAAGMRKLFPNIDFPSDFAGKFESNLIGTPVIEVAGDGKTAKGVWVSLMTVGKTHENDPKMNAIWIWWKIGADFVKEDGEWKIWHYAKNPVYATTYDKSWVDNAIARATGVGFGPGVALGVGAEHGSGKASPQSSRGTTLDSSGKIKPSHGTTADRPTSELYNSYSITGEAKLIPKPPEPFKTFNEEDAYVYPSLPVD